MGSTCQNTRLQAINSFDEGVQNNLQIHSEEAPLPSYAVKATQWPELSQRVLKVIEDELGKQTISHEGTTGKFFPLFYIIQKQAFYEGEWKMRLPHGKGKLFFETGEYFQGVFMEGEAYSRNGLFIYRDGSYYRGEIQHSVFEGRGKFVSIDGTVFEGQWKNNKPEGLGKEIFSDGNQYEGRFVNGLKEGYGVFKWGDGKVFRGQFKAGKMHGKGVISKGQDSLFEGEFQDNKKKGKGTLTTPYGTYNGEFNNGEFGGKGKFTWRDGRVLIGEFSNGHLKGQGTLQFPSGKSHLCVWKEGKMEVIPTNKQPE